MPEKYQPPSGAAGNAKKVLRWRDEHGDEVKGMTQTGWVRARQLASGKPVSADIVKRMAAFNRHRKNASVDPEYKDTPWKDRGYVAWLGWGGDTGINWAIKTSETMGKPKAELKASKMDEIKIYGDVDTGLSDLVKNNLPDGPVTVRINSDGGSVREGLAIYNMLKEHPYEVTTVIDGGAFSIAAYIALAGDRRLISENGMMMVHGARTETYGNLSQHEQTLDMLRTADNAMRKAFVATTGMSDEDAMAMMAVDTWLDADQALAEGLVTEITREKPPGLVAFSDNIIKLMPPRLVAKLTPKEDIVSQDKSPKAASYHQLKAINKDKDFIVAMLENEATEEEAVEANLKAMEEKAEMADALAEENEELKARIYAMEQELKGMEEGDDKEPEAVEEPEEKEAEAKDHDKVPRAKGVAPVARANSVPKLTAKQQWDNAIESEVKNGRDRATAVRNANRKNPGLRAAYLNEINK